MKGMRIGLEGIELVDRADQLGVREVVRVGRESSEPRIPSLGSISVDSVRHGPRTDLIVRFFHWRAASRRRGCACQATFYVKRTVGKRKVGNQGETTLSLLAVGHDQEFCL